MIDEDTLCDVLGFCGCGNPEAAIEYVRRGLGLIDSRRREESFEAIWDRELAHFGSNGAAMFFWYWCDREGYTEHGGSVPGWLTEKGNEMLSKLKAMEAGGE